MSEGFTVFEHRHYLFRPTNCHFNLCYSLLTGESAFLTATIESTNISVNLNVSQNRRDCDMSIRTTNALVFTKLDIHGSNQIAILVSTTIL